MLVKKFLVEISVPAKDFFLHNLHYILLVQSIILLGFCRVNYLMCISSRGTLNSNEDLKKQINTVNSSSN